MIKANHWVVCLDLSQMDDVLIRYVQFLAKTLKPDQIEFVHILETAQFSDDIARLFPELNDKKDLEEIIRSELKSKINSCFKELPVGVALTIMEGNPTNQIITFIEQDKPDLLILGKKTGYAGEGVMASRVVKYVPNSVLFVPETSRYQLKTILIPSDFSAQSADAITAAGHIRKELNDGTEIIGQHVFRYPAHFFPYMPSDKEKQKIRDHLEQKRSQFFKKNDLNEDDLSFVISLTNKDKKTEEIYNEVVRKQVDLIMLAAKGDKSLMSLLKEDFTDKMINYAFGIPLLIRKNRKRHERYLSAFLSK